MPEFNNNNENIRNAQSSFRGLWDYYTCGREFIFHVSIENHVCVLEIKIKAGDGMVCFHFGMLGINLG